MSSRLEDLRDLARMLDEGKISEREYEIVKTELLEAPAEEWESEPVTSVSDSPDDEPVAEPSLEPEPDKGWLTTLRELPTTYRAAAAGAVLVLVVGSFIVSRGDAAGTVNAIPRRDTPVVETPPADSLGVSLDGLTDGWNAVEDPPLISGGITTSPEPGPLDSFLHRFNSSALLAGAYDPTSGYVHALIVRSNLHYEPSSSLHIHLCYLIHPGSQECLDTFLDETGLFGETPEDLLGTEQSVAWEFEGHEWQFEVGDDVETIRVQGGDPGD